MARPPIPDRIISGISFSGNWYGPKLLEQFVTITGKLRALGWAPQVPFEQGLADTVRWYRENEWWWRPIKERDPAFKAYYEAQYGRRS